MNLPLIPVFMLCVLTACGGPSKEAKVATAIQSIMSNLISGNLQVLGGSAAITDPVPCGASGTYTVSTTDPNYGNIDPSNPGLSATAQITYDNCTYKVCGDTVTLKGDKKTSITLSATALGVIEISMQAADEDFSGVISGTQSFGYKMSGNATASTLGNVELFELSPAQPLELSGFRYEASKLNALADGC